MSILALAPNGAYKTKQDHPNLPIVDDEIITEVKSCSEFGIKMFHLHIRDKNGKHSIDAKHYQKLLNKLPKDLILQITSESASVFSAYEQVQSIKELKPKFVSIALREINRLDKPALQNFFIWIKENQVNPQIIIYNQDDALNYQNLIQNKILGAINFPVLVVVGKGEDNFEKVNEIINTIKEWTTSIMLCGFAKLEHKVISYCLENNFDIRIGFENNLTNLDGETAKNNIERVEQVLKNIKQLDNLDVSINKLTPNWL